MTSIQTDFLFRFPTILRISVGLFASNWNESLVHHFQKYAWNLLWPLNAWWRLFFSDTMPTRALETLSEQSHISKAGMFLFYYGPRHMWSSGKTRVPLQTAFDICSNPNTEYGFFVVFASTCLIFATKQISTHICSLWTLAQPHFVSV